jgi:hypothetical protein
VLRPERAISRRHCSRRTASEALLGSVETRHDFFYAMKSEERRDASPRADSKKV